MADKKNKPEPIIQTAGLIYEYQTGAAFEDPPPNPAPLDRAAALNGVDIRIERGTFVAILGHNGSGKSTLARHMNALLTPSSGSVWVDGMDTKDAALIRAIRQTAGMVFQNPDNQLIATIVEEDVAFGPENLGVPPPEIRARVDAALQTVGMASYRDRSPHFLSGGQKQRVAIAGILAMQPACIVLDEPTAMLDPVGRSEVINAVKRLNRYKGMTIILITHYMEEAVQADRVIVMDRGAIVMDDAPAAVFGRVEALKALGLDVPQVTECAWLLRKAGIPLPEGILTIPALTEALCRYKDQNAGIHPPPAKGLPLSRKAPRARLRPPVRPRTRAGVSGFHAAPAFELKGLTHLYNPGTAFQKKALDDINLTIPKGAFVGLIGHTGSGKSTLIQHLNALLQPTAGQILLNGTDINADRSKLKSIRQKVGLVFQYPEHQLFEMTVAKDVAFGPENMGLAPVDVAARVRESLTLTGIPESLFDQSPFGLSGGQKRRVAIAGVLAMRPDVLILDEPTAGLDPKGRDEILNSLKATQDSLGITVVLVSHSMEDIARFADLVIVMREGRVAMQGDCAAVFRRETALRQMGLSSPMISLAAAALRRQGFLIPKDLYTVPMAAAALLRLLRP